MGDDLLSKLVHKLARRLPFVFRNDLTEHQITKLVNRLAEPYQLSDAVLVIVRRRVGTVDCEREEGVYLRSAPQGVIFERTTLTTGEMGSSVVVAERKTN
jgi:hypothetical protein